LEDVRKLWKEMLFLVDNLLGATNFINKGIILIL
jgi:hypothetical protein